MTESSLSSLKRLYSAYVDGYRGEGGALPDMMALKLKHTGLVVANAREIAMGEGFDANVRLVCEAAALLHDTGRYEQLKRYNTFRDADSVDHAVFSHDIVKERGWLEEALVPENEREAILTAVLVHNRRVIPDGLDSLTLATSCTVRDSDKLDIFRVMEDQIAAYDWRKDARAFWNLPVKAAPSPAVLKAIRERRPVDYGEIASLPDFVIIQVGWMISELYYATTKRLVANRGHLAFRRKFLKELTDDGSVDEICDLAEASLKDAP